MRSPCTQRVSDHSLLFARTVGVDGARLFTVLEELSNELAPINPRRVLREGTSKTMDPSELDDSEVAVRHRKREQGRRTTIRDLQHQLSGFFLVEEGRKVSGGELLLFGESIASKSGFYGSLTKLF